MSQRSAARIEMGSGTGVRAAADTFSFFEITSPLLLLQVATAIATTLSAVLAFRSSGLLTNATVPWVLAGPSLVMIVMLALRVPMRELLRSLGPRERAALVFVHIAFFLFPLFDPNSRYLPLAFTSVQLPMILLLMQPRQYVRLQSVQLVAVLSSALLDRFDDTLGAVVIACFLGALIVQTYALRVVTVSETYEVSPRMTLGMLTSSLGPVLCLMALSTTAVIWMVAGRNWSRVFSMNIDWNRRPGAGAAGGGGFNANQFGRLVVWFAIGIGALIAAAYLLDKLREAIDKRRREREMDLDYAIASFESNPEVARTLRSLPPVGRRRRLIAAYMKLLDRIGRVRRAREEGETAGEYERVVTSEGAWQALTESMADARAGFEPVRYGAEEPDDETLAAFEAQLGSVAERLRDLPADPRPTRGSRPGR